jgi:hypothetical protein
VGKVLIYFGAALFAGAFPSNLAIEGTMAIVTPRRRGSVNFVITQDIANVPTEFKMLQCEKIKMGSFVCKCE